MLIEGNNPYSYEGFNPYIYLNFKSKANVKQLRPATTALIFRQKHSDNANPAEPNNIDSTTGNTINYLA